jgi:hypothetical protein
MPGIDHVAVDRRLLPDRLEARAEQERLPQRMTGVMLPLIRRKVLVRAFVVV